MPTADRTLGGVSRRGALLPVRVPATPTSRRRPSRQGRSVPGVIFVRRLSGVGDVLAERPDGESGELALVAFLDAVYQALEVINGCRGDSSETRRVVTELSCGSDRVTCNIGNRLDSRVILSGCEHVQRPLCDISTSYRVCNMAAWWPVWNALGTLSWPWLVRGVRSASN